MSTNYLTSDRVKMKKEINIKFIKVEKRNLGNSQL